MSSKARVTESVRKIMERLRARRVGAPASRPLPSEPKGPKSDSLPAIDPNARSGLTVFDDRALRLRTLTLLTESGKSAEMEDPGALPGAFKIRIAKREGFQQAAGTLVDRRYSDRGYDTPVRKQESSLFTFVAYDEGKLVGTVGIRIDFPPGHLNADALYEDELTVMREAGCKLCEFTRLAVDATAISKPVLAGLFHTAYLYAGALHGCTFMVIEVIPRHVPFYNRALGFEPIGAERMNPRVNTRGVLLSCSFETIADGLKRFGGRYREFPTERSLFPWGFSPAEETGILQRLKALDAERQSV